MDIIKQHAAAIKTLCQKNDIEYLGVMDDRSYWSFAIVNDQLAEIHYIKNSEGIDIFGHCYVSADEYTSPKEQEYIKQDTKQFHFVWKNGHYQSLH